MAATPLIERGGIIIFLIQEIFCKTEVPLSSYHFLLSSQHTSYKLPLQTATNKPEADFPHRDRTTSPTVPIVTLYLVAFISFLYFQHGLRRQVRHRHALHRGGCWARQVRRALLREVPLVNTPDHCRPTRTKRSQTDWKRLKISCLTPGKTRQEGRPAWVIVLANCEIFLSLSSLVWIYTSSGLGRFK